MDIKDALKKLYKPDRIVESKDWNTITPLFNGLCWTDIIMERCDIADGATLIYERDSNIEPLVASNDGNIYIDMITSIVTTNWHNIALKISECDDVKEKRIALLDAVYNNIPLASVPNMKSSSVMLIITCVFNIIREVCDDIVREHKRQTIDTIAHQQPEKLGQQKSDQMNGIPTKIITERGKLSNTLDAISTSISQMLSHHNFEAKGKFDWAVIEKENPSTLKITWGQYVFTASALEGVIVDSPSVILNHYIGARKSGDNVELVYDVTNADWYMIRLLDSCIDNALNAARAEMLNTLGKRFNNIGNWDHKSYITKESLKAILSKFREEYMTFMQLDDDEDVVIDIYPDAICGSNYIIRVVTGNMKNTESSYMDMQCQEAFLTVNPNLKAVMISADFPWVSTGYNLYSPIPFETKETDFITYTHKNALQFIMYNLFAYDLAKFSPLESLDRKTPEDVVNKFVSMYVKELQVTFGIKQKIKTTIVKSYNDGVTMMGTGSVCVYVAIDGVGLIDAVITDEVTRNTPPESILCNIADDFNPEVGYGHAITWDQSKDATKSTLNSVCKTVSIVMNKVYNERS